MGLRCQQAEGAELGPGQVQLEPSWSGFLLEAVPRLHHLSAALIKAEREAPCTLDSISLLKHKLSFTHVGNNYAKLKILATLLMNSAQNLRRCTDFHMEVFGI